MSLESLGANLLKQGWKHWAMPYEGIHTTLFLGPSPLFCISGTHVWFDHTDERFAGCVATDVINKVMPVDRNGQKAMVYDWIKCWDSFMKEGALTINHRMCLRQL